MSQRSTWPLPLLLGMLAGCSAPAAGDGGRAPAAPAADPVPVPVAAAPATAPAAAAAGGHLEPLPAQADGRGPLVLLEAEPAVAESGAGLIRAGGTVAAVAGGRSETSAHEVALVPAGAGASSLTLAFTLDGNVRPGTYAVWVSCRQGGVGRLGFTLAAGRDPAALGRRLDFRASNAVSWSGEWLRAADPLQLLPGDRALSLTLAASGATRKLVDAVLLAPLEADRGTDAAAAQVRAQALGRPEPAAPRLFAYVLDDLGDDVVLGRLLPPVVAAPDQAALAVRYLAGGRARRFAADCGIATLPAVAIADADARLRGVAEAGAPPGLLPALLDGGAGPQPVPPAPATPAVEPLREGRPAAWLATSALWAGPCGASLNGIDSEALLRPAPGDPCTAVQFDTTAPGTWQAVAPTATGAVVLVASTGNSTWARASGMACLYLRADAATRAELRLEQSGVQTLGWLDGAPLALVRDRGAAAAERREHGRTDQGNDLEVSLASAEGPVRAPLALTPGWHCLMLKLVMQHRAGEVFQFRASLVDVAGRPLAAQTCLADPEQDAAGHALARRLVPSLRAAPPGCLHRVGEAMRLAVDFACARRVEDRGEPLPMPPLAAQAELVLTDYDGRELARRTLPAQLPGTVEADFGPAQATGYHGLRIALRSPDGSRPLATYASDGFSVIAGSAARQARGEACKLATTYYFLSPAHHEHQGGTRSDVFRWMQRMGIRRNIGSSPGFDAGLWDEARQCGITLTADFWDLHNSESPAAKQRFAHAAAVHGRWFKSFNEVDIVPATKGTAERWVARTRIEREAVKAARPDGFYVGGSLVRPGRDPWFDECLRLGLDGLLDAWDVHAYPQLPPRLGGMMANSANESEPGVLMALARAGRANRLPFWLGETGARACHGLDARRWQAAMVAKMTAWANSRPDYQVIGFLIPFSYSRPSPTRGPGDIAVAHHPGEAALYTAGALIDGLPFTDHGAAGSPLVVGRFGPTWMLWNEQGPGTHRFDPGVSDPVLVDVVGRVADLARQADGTVAITVGSSPVYVLDRADHRRLTAD